MKENAWVCTSPSKQKRKQQKNPSSTGNKRNEVDLLGLEEPTLDPNWFTALSNVMGAGNAVGAGSTAMDGNANGAIEVERVLDGRSRSALLLRDGREYGWGLVASECLGDIVPLTWMV